MRPLAELCDHRLHAEQFGFGEDRLGPSSKLPRGFREQETELLLSDDHVA
jgi:hypothetical protein